MSRNACVGIHLVVFTVPTPVRTLDTIYEILLYPRVSRGVMTHPNVFVSPDIVLSQQYGRISISDVCGDLLHYFLFVATATIVLASLAIVNDVTSRLSAVGAILCESSMCP